MNPVNADWRSYADVDFPRPLDAALRLFSELGYHGTSVRQIAAESGLTVPGLYYHFPSKQAMLATLLQLVNQDLWERAQLALAEAGDDPRARFVALMENLVLFVTKRQSLALLPRELRCLEEPYRSRHIELRDRLEALVTTEVNRAKKLGQFETASPREAARAAVVLCRSVAEWYRPEGPLTPRQLAKRYVQFCLALVGNKE